MFVDDVKFVHDGQNYVLHLKGLNCDTPPTHNVVVSWEPAEGETADHCRANYPLHLALHILLEGAWRVDDIECILKAASMFDSEGTAKYMLKQTPDVQKEIIKHLCEKVEVIAKYFVTNADALWDAHHPAK